MNLNTRIYFRCTEEEKKRLFDLCDQHNITVQSYCYSKIMEAIKKDYEKYKNICMNCGSELTFKNSKDNALIVAKCPNCGYVSHYPKKDGDVK